MHEPIKSRRVPLVGILAVTAALTNVTAGTQWYGNDARDRAELARTAIEAPAMKVELSRPMSVEQLVESHYGVAYDSRIGTAISKGIATHNQYRIDRLENIEVIGGTPVFGAGPIYLPQVEARK